MKKIFLFALLTFTLNVFAQVSKTVNCTAGNLSSVLNANEKSTVTNLTIKGIVDARDFKTMRDDMPLLKELDLSGVTIVAYNGTEGTSTWGNDYPANAIPESAFMYANWQGKNSLTWVKLPDSLISIVQNAFYSCKGLATISFPSMCTIIGDDTFSFCSGLATVFIPSSLTSIGERVFMGCTGLINVEDNNPNYSGSEGVLFNKTQTSLIQCPSSKTGAYSVPQTVTAIVDYAFRECKGLVTVNLPHSLSYLGLLAFYNCTNLDGTLTIPSSINSIGHEAFSHCLNLDIVNIPSSVTSIGNYAFYDCGGLLNVDNNNPNYSSEDGILFNKTKTMLIQCGSSRQDYYTIPASVTTIGPSAFSRCKILTGVKIPSSVTTIGTNAFWGCSSMLGSITFPASVHSIGNYAFSGCTGLTAIYSYATEPVDISSSTQVFYNVNKSSCTLYVPKGSKSAYQSAYQWNEFTNIIEMPGFTFSSTSVKIEAAQGSKAAVDITSDVAWKAVSDQSWLSVSPGSGSGNGKLTFTATANPTNTIRTAKVTVSATGIEPRTISIVQSYALQPNITKLYDFECQYPYSFAYNSRLVYNGTYLYGIMGDISFDPKSKLIRIKPDGSNFEVLHEFDFSGYADVYLTLSGNILYGTVNEYGTQDILFRINTDGSNYSKFNFVNDNKLNLGNNSIIISNNLIYGSSHDYSSSNGKQNLFKVNTDGSGYFVLYSSTENSFDNLTLSGNTIIGVSSGKVVKVNMDGSGFFDFGINSDIPVIVDKNIIYGMKSAYEGTDGYIFKVNMDGSGFTKIKSITYPDFGSSPIVPLSIVGNSIYGMAENNSGIFKINTDGTGFIKIPTELQISRYSTSAELTQVGNELFGFASEGSVAIFKINTTNDKFAKVFKFGSSTSGMFPMGSLVESGNFLYGNTISGGNFDMGTLFRINKDGSGYTKLFEFKGPETGAGPVGQLTLIGTQLYGTASGGLEQTENGCIFKINIDGTGYTILHEFDVTNGASPNGSLVLHNGCLYGITGDGGKESHGVVFKINLDGTGFTKISDNTDLETGENPYNGITISTDDVIYGVTAIDYGGVFRVNTDGLGLRKIFEMNYESGDFSFCKPLLINDELYITTSERGANGIGTIFKIKTDGTGFTLLYCFEGIDDNTEGSGFRNNSLMLHNGVLYGTATGNGINNHGYLYRINLDGTGFTKLSDFNGEFGSMPYLCDLIIDNNADIYGMTTFGGNYSGGIIYKYSLNETWISSKGMDENKLVQVFPNPVKDGFRISGIKGNSTLWLTDINGKLLLTKEIENNEYISAKSLPTGVYILRINSKAGILVKKLVKE